MTLSAVYQITYLYTMTCSVDKVIHCQQAGVAMPNPRYLARKRKMLYYKKNLNYYRVIVYISDGTAKNGLFADQGRNIS